ncbi:hypothetical protein QUA86_31195 [Microcoleus sp. F6_B6]
MEQQVATVSGPRYEGLETRFLGNLAARNQKSRKKPGFQGLRAIAQIIEIH